jgi:Transmembrane amino acid transporter protein
VQGTACSLCWLHYAKYPCPSLYSTLCASFCDTVLPEIQASVREPNKRNMQRGIVLSYIIISVSYLAVAITGYWAFGATVHPFVVRNTTARSHVCLHIQLPPRMRIVYTHTITAAAATAMHRCTLSPVLSGASRLRLPLPLPRLLAASRYTNLHRNMHMQSMSYLSIHVIKPQNT